MVWLKRRGTWTLRLVTAVSAAVAVAACGAAGIDDGDSGGREAKYKRVIEDPHPRPADVIEAAGAPTGVVRADDGSLLLSYDVLNVEDDEGPAAFAWRIVGPDGRTVAEHAEHGNAEAVRTAFKGVSGGFVRVPSGEGADGAYLLDVRGKRHKVVTTDTPMRTRPGDILLAELEPTLVYRPATRTVAPPAGVPDDAILLAVDERGTVWSLEQFLTDEPNRVVWQRDGRTLGSRAAPKTYSDAGGILVAGGGTAALSLTQDEDVRGLLVTTDDGEHWQTVRDGGIPWKTLKGGPVSLFLSCSQTGGCSSARRAAATGSPTTAPTAPSTSSRHRHHSRRSPSTARRSTASLTRRRRRTAWSRAKGCGSLRTTGASGSGTSSADSSTAVPALARAVLARWRHGTCAWYRWLLHASG